MGRDGPLGRLIPQFATVSPSGEAVASGALAGSEVPRLVGRRRVTSGVVAAALVVGLALAVFLDAAVTAPAMQWSVFRQWLFNPAILEGVRDTVELTVGCEGLAIVSGVVLAAMLLSRNSVLHAVTHAYQWGFRSVPEIAHFPALHDRAPLRWPRRLVDLDECRDDAVGGGARRAWSARGCLPRRGLPVGDPWRRRATARGGTLARPEPYPDRAADRAAPGDGVESRRTPGAA
jgi:hypothetical protein